MRILHTADWHMGVKLGSVDRREDTRRSLKAIYELLVAQKIEVMVVAGDLFRERLSRDEFGEAVAELAEIFTPWIQTGGTFVAISGNHDTIAHFETLRDALKLAPGVAKGRVHFYSKPDILRLADESGQHVAFVLIPYPNERFLFGDWDDAETMNQSKEDTYRRVVKTLCARVRHDEKALLVSHIHVRGVRVGSYEVGEADDTLVSPGDLPLHFAYAAFGHIHRAQPVAENTPNARYSGSIIRMDLGEKDDEKGVIVLDIQPGPEPVLPVWYSLPNVAPIKEVNLTAMGDEIGALEPDSEALVHATVRYTPGEANISQVRRRLRELYPRLYALREERTDATVRQPGQEIKLGNVRENVLAYLGLQLHGKPYKDKIIERVLPLLPAATVLDEVTPTQSPVEKEILL